MRKSDFWCLGRTVIDLGREEDIEMGSCLLEGMRGRGQQMARDLRCRSHLDNLKHFLPQGKSNKKME